ncbi:hypothetical protein SCARD494_00122 [Seiridium cardinale]
MHRNTLLALLTLAEAAPHFGGGGGGGTTMLRLGCPQLVVDRLDPLVNAGVIPSPHLHHIIGGNGFNASMTTSDVSATATCTTCEFSEDFTNYWTANLYFEASNGTYKRGPQRGARMLKFSDTYSNKMADGILVYYVSAQPGSMTAFKPGFRMLVGNPNQRSRPDTTLKHQNCHRCYTGPNYGGDVSAPYQDNSIDTEAFPTKACKCDIRSNIHFPTCWDGKNLDSPNHKSHVAYPVSGPATFLSLGGACPSTHPVCIPQLMYEVVWDTKLFNDPNEWPMDGSQPFYLSTGDITGLGQHAGYVFGWKGDALQKAMNATNFMGAKCADLKTQRIDAGTKCGFKRVVDEDHDGC